MLKHKIRTADETQQYMKELKKWLNEAADIPVEEMSDFFAQRIDIYDDVHLGNWGEEYRHIADFLMMIYRRCWISAVVQG